ncbi:YezD family protein [Cytobacillus firmus]|nr:YezD family protein [Cytobacillus firmus]
MFSYTKKRRRASLKQADWEELSAHLKQMLGSIKFGSITLVVQDGKVIQLEKNEKVRLQPNKRAD